MTEGLTRRAVLAAAPLAALPGSAVAYMGAPQWGVHEITLHGPSSGNPYADVQLAAVFTNGETSFTVDGFYDGEGIYRIRFSPPAAGSGAGARAATLRR